MSIKEIIFKISFVFQMIFDVNPFSFDFTIDKTSFKIAAILQNISTKDRLALTKLR